MLSRRMIIMHLYLNKLICILTAYFSFENRNLAHDPEIISYNSLSFHNAIFSLFSF